MCVKRMKSFKQNRMIPETRQVLPFILPTSIYSAPPEPAPLQRLSSHECNGHGGSRCLRHTQGGLGRKTQEDLLPVCPPPSPGPWPPMLLPLPPGQARAADAEQGQCADDTHASTRPHAWDAALSCSLSAEQSTCPSTRNPPPPPPAQTCSTPLLLSHLPVPHNHQSQKSEHFTGLLFPLQRNPNQPP